MMVMVSMMMMPAKMWMKFMMFTKNRRYIALSSITNIAAVTIAIPMRAMLSPMAMEWKALEFHLLYLNPTTNSDCLRSVERKTMWELRDTMPVYFDLKWSLKRLTKDPKRLVWLKAQIYPLKNETFHSLTFCWKRILIFYQGKSLLVVVLLIPNPPPPHMMFFLLTS